MTDDPRSATNPLFNDNKLKLGLFGLNAGAQIMSLAPDRYVGDWDRVDGIAATVDTLGLEAMVSLMGWMGDTELEPFSWAAGLTARHSNFCAISTFHMPIMPPTFVARAAATIDRISHGRYGLIVAGFNPHTFAAFGAKALPHDGRYEHATEFMELLRKLWTSEEHFSFEGQYFNIPRVRCNPLPIQQLPPIMNAGISGKGQDFACKYADLVFTLLEPDRDAARAQIAHYKKRAREEFGREVQVWTHGHIVIRDTEREANDFLDYYAVEHADRDRIAEWLKALNVADATHDDPEKLKRLHSGWAAGAGNRLVGTAEQVAEELGRLSDIGLDGIIWNTIEPETLLGHVASGLLPALEAMGYRKPFRPHDGAVARAA